ncbi:MAG: hypothetical protein N4A53_08280 [Pelagimonas sp.]|jgi:hypothetical protein|nr:hypothetical protein [Pelagimonas sp.]
MNEREKMGLAPGEFVDLEAAKTAARRRRVQTPVLFHKGSDSFLLILDGETQQRILAHGSGTLTLHDRENQIGEARIVVVAEFDQGGDSHFETSETGSHPIGREGVFDV